MAYSIAGKDSVTDWGFRRGVVWGWGQVRWRCLAVGVLYAESILFNSHEPPPFSYWFLGVGAKSMIGQRKMSGGRNQSKQGRS